MDKFTDLKRAFRRLHINTIVSLILLSLQLVFLLLSVRLLVLRQQFHTGEADVWEAVFLFSCIVCSFCAGLCSLIDAIRGRRYLVLSASFLKDRRPEALEALRGQDPVAGYLYTLLCSGILSAQHGEDASEQEQSLLLLRGQINPHFLYNTIDSIRSQAVSENAGSVANMLELFGVIIRDTLHSNEPLRPFGQELDSVKNYIKIQQYRLTGRFSVVYDVDEDDSELMAYFLPALALQPVVENALLHGIEPLNSRGTIRIGAERTDRYLRITVADNGVGISDDELSRINADLSDEYRIRFGTTTATTGIALANINTRIRGYYGSEYGLHLISLQGRGTTVEFLLPAKGIEHVG